MRATPSQNSGSALTPWLIAGLAVAGAMWVERRLRGMQRKMSFAGRTVVIVGGSRGLGLALAHEFAAAGARIALCARQADELATAAADIGGTAPAVKTVVCDATDEQQMTAAVQTIERELGPIDVLVNCAGTIVVGPWDSMTVADFRQTMDANFWSAMHAMMAALPAMKSRRQGRIVNVASIGGKMPVPHLAAYCASKYALVGLSETLRAELEKDHVLITTVNPGLMRTGSPRNASFKGDYRAEYTWFAISDSLPAISVSARHAARKILMAARYGLPEITIGWPAALASRFHGLAPAMNTEITALLNRLLPASDGHAPMEKRPGHASESRLTRSLLTRLSRNAEKQYHQRLATDWSI